MASKLPIVLADTKILNNIRKELREDPKRLAKQMELFQAWIRCEDHLPNDVDAHMRENFIRLCKCDLEKAKSKFEKFLAARKKNECYYANRILNEYYFETFPVHKQIILHPQLTPDGYRICFVNLPKSADHFDLFQLVHFLCLTLDFILFEDTFAGCILVYNFENFSASLLGKVNIKKTLEAVDLIYNIYPIRLKALHFTNVPRVAVAFLELVKMVMKDKIAKRIVTHRDPTDVVKYIPENMMPEEYGGSGKSLDELADANKSYFLQNKNWASKTDNLKFVGPLPSNKKYLYSFYESEMIGSFRLLDID